MAMTRYETECWCAAGVETGLEAIHCEPGHAEALTDANRWWAALGVDRGTLAAAIASGLEYQEHALLQQRMFVDGEVDGVDVTADRLVFCQPMGAEHNETIPPLLVGWLTGTDAAFHPWPAQLAAVEADLERPAVSA